MRDDDARMHEHRLMVVAATIIAASATVHHRYSKTFYNEVRTNQCQTPTSTSFAANLTCDATQPENYGDDDNNSSDDKVKKIQ